MILQHFQRYSLCNESPLKDLEKVFHQPSSQPSSQSVPDVSRIQQSDVEELLSIVTSLRSRLTQLESEVSDLRARQKSQSQSSTISSPSISTTDSDTEGDTEGPDSEQGVFLMPSKQRKKAR